MEIKWRMYFIFNSHMIFSRVAVITEINSGLNYLEKLLKKNHFTFVKIANAICFTDSYCILCVYK